MFIPNIPRELYIGNPADLYELIGQPIWVTGQGGTSSVSRRHLGQLLSIESRDPIIIGPSDRFITENRRLGTHLIDHHVFPQEYNNWYLCKSEDRAIEIFNLVRKALDL